MLKFYKKMQLVPCSAAERNGYIMKKIFRHIKRWNHWRKCSLNSKWNKLLVLLGVIKSPSFHANEAIEAMDMMSILQEAFYDALSNYDALSKNFQSISTEVDKLGKTFEEFNIQKEKNDEI